MHLGSGTKAVGEKVEQRGVVDPAGKGRPGEECLGLRCEEEGAWEGRPVERLLSRAIPGAEQGPLDLVPDREGEHPGEPRQRALTPAAKGFQQHFGVARGPEPNAVRLQLLFQLPVVVELAVVDQQEAAVMRGEGLVGLGQQIDDGEPSVAQPDLPIAREPGRCMIRPPVRQVVAHPIEHAGVDGGEEIAPTMPHMEMERGKGRFHDKALRWPWMGPKRSIGLV